MHDYTALSGRFERCRQFYLRPRQRLRLQSWRQRLRRLRLQTQQRPEAYGGLGAAVARRLRTLQ